MMPGKLEQCLRSAISAEEELVQDILAACRLTHVEVHNLAEWSPEQVAERLFLTPEEANKLVDACRSEMEAGVQVKSVTPDMTVMEALPEKQEPVPAIEEEANHAVAAEAFDIVLIDEDEPTGVAMITRDRPTKTRTAEELPEVPEPVVCEEPVLPAPVCSASPKRGLSALPSYLRATKSSLRSSKQFAEQEAAVDKKSPVKGKDSKTKDPKSKESKGGFMSRLLAPTAAFLARVTRSKAESKAGREAAEAQQALRKSQMLSMVLSSPQGQRITKTLPFALAVDNRPKTPSNLTTDEMRMQEAQKQAFKRHVVPAHVHESRPVEGFRAHSSPRDPQDVFQPFQLASMEMHEKYREMREARLREETRKSEEARKFKAQEFDKVQEILSSPAGTTRRVAPAPVTIAHAPSFASVGRAEHHAKVLEPARRARMTQAEREALEARERRAAEAVLAAEAGAEAKAVAAAKEAALMAMDVSQLRKSMVFKARDLPDFSAPFRPDPSKATPVTRSVDFSLQTTKRLGEAVPARDRVDAAAPQISGSQCFSPNQFSCSLRSSQQFAASPRGYQSMRMSVSSLSPRSPGARALMSPSASNLRASTSRLALPSSRNAPSMSSPSPRPIAPRLKEALGHALGAAMPGGSPRGPAAHIAPPAPTSPRADIYAI